MTPLNLIDFNGQSRYIQLSRELLMPLIPIVVRAQMFRSRQMIDTEPLLTSTGVGHNGQTGLAHVTTIAFHRIHGLFPLPPPQPYQFLG